MLDQSFSAENFKTIFDIANRQGLFIEDKLSLTTVRAITKEIKIYGDLAKQKKVSGDLKLATFFNEVKEAKREERHIEIDRVLGEISTKVSQRDFNILLKKIQIPGGKDLYTIDKTPEYFFCD